MRLVRLRLLYEVHVYLSRQLCVVERIVQSVFFSTFKTAMLQDLIEELNLALRQAVREVDRAAPSLRLRQHLEVINALKGRSQHLVEVVLDAMRHNGQVRVLVEEVGEDAARAPRPVDSAFPL